MKVQFLVFLFSLCLCSSLAAQSAHGTILGEIKESQNNEPVEGALIYEKNEKIAVESDSKGHFQLRVPAQKELTIIIQRVGFDKSEVTVKAMNPGEVRNISIALTTKDAGLSVVITAESIGDKNMVRANVEEFKLLPSVSGNIESLLPSIALGTSGGTGGELTSQYNVRGGNYDENLVYVNGFEIFRSQLIRAGQQEGLSFPNQDLIRELSFSSGGFEAKYGDKMSSVLDIKYKRPEQFKGSFMASLLGASAHAEGSFFPGKNAPGKVRFLVGARYKTTQYLLNSLEVKGEYLPNFADIQGYVTYDFSKQLQLALIGNYNLSKYNYVPNSSETPTGTFLSTLRLDAEYQGQERDKFLNSMGGISLSWISDSKSSPAFVKFLSSAYHSDERESYDILSQFEIKVTEPDFDKGGTKDIATLGGGTQHNFARNSLQNLVYNAEVKSGIEFPHFSENHESSHFIYGGIKYQNEHFLDQLNEWYRTDSVGYSLPYDEDQYFLASVLKSTNDIQSHRMTAFVQETYTYKKKNKYEIQATVGMRAGYWTFNNEFIWSPRAQLLFQPLGRHNPLTLKLAGGVYQQPPFYREMRRPDGTLNYDIKSQKSIQGITGITYDFEAGKREPVRLRFIAEAYYKSMWDLIPYNVDNVRVSYLGENNATGYATGLDMRLNGEFVNGFESWLNVSFLRTREKLDGVQHLDLKRQPVNDVPRPTDQFFQAALYFQDYLPQNKNFQVHLQISYGTGYPYGVPWENYVQRNPLRFKDYQRVDIGFSYLIWDQSRKDKQPHHILRFTKNTWLNLEVFNLLDARNVANYNWVKDFNNIAYAFPSTLTSRRINLKIRMEF